MGIKIYYVAIDSVREFILRICRCLKTYAQNYINDSGEVFYSYSKIFETKKKLETKTSSQYSPRRISFDDPDIDSKSLSFKTHHPITSLNVIQV